MSSCDRIRRGLGCAAGPAHMEIRISAENREERIKEWLGDAQSNANQRLLSCSRKPLLAAGPEEIPLISPVSRRQRESLQPAGSQIAAIARGKSAASTPCIQENKKQKTGWRWTQSLANSSPSKFPANREKYRELSPFAPNPVEISVWQRAL